MKQTNLFRYLAVMVMALLMALPSAAGKVKLHTIGDSTMDGTYDPNTTYKRGWCMMLQQFFNADELTVNNRGKSGASSKSFYKESAYWPTLVKGGSDQMQAGDYLIIQFAHNDEKSKGTDGDELKAYYTAKGDAASAAKVDYRGTTPFDTYKKYIRAYINEAKAMGVKPIVVGAICRKYFKDAGGTKINASGRHNLYQKFDIIKDGALKTDQKLSTDDHSMDYPYQAHKVADEFDDVPYIDLTAITAELYESYGEAYCTANLFGPDDSTHPGAMGATLISRAFVQQLLKQASEETDAKKKAVLQGLAQYAVMSNEISFSPTSGDMGKASVGTEVVKEFNISAYGLAPSEGRASITVSGGFEVSLDKNTWAASVDAAYTGATLLQTVYVRGTAMAETISGQLTVSDGTNSKSLDLTLASVSLPGGASAEAVWTLNAGQKGTEGSPLILADQTLQELKVSTYANIGAGDNIKKMQLLTTEDGNWPADEIDEVSTRYAQFKLTVPQEKSFLATKVSLTVSGRGGSAVSFKAYCATKSDFSDQVLIAEKLQIAKDAPQEVSKSVAQKVGEGESLYIRIYPWLNKQSAVASGKYLCLSDVKVEGVIADAVTEVTVGLTRELNGTTFAEGQETAFDGDSGLGVTNISTTDYAGKNQTLKHGAATPVYTAPSVWRNYSQAQGAAVQGKFNDGFYWGFKVSIPDGQVLNITKIYSDVYGVKNTLTSKFVVKASLAGSAIYTSQNHAANVENGGEACKATEDVTAVEALKGLTGDIYVLMPWYSGSSATYYACKDFTITGTLSNGEIKTKMPLHTAVTPEGAGMVVTDPEGISFAEGTKVKLTAQKNFGYAFKEWQENGKAVGVAENYTVTMDEEKTLTAVFEPVPVYTVSTRIVNDQEKELGGIALSPDKHSGKYEAGEEVTATAETSKILKFMNWEDNSTANPRTFTVEGDKEITANYEVQDFIAVFDASKVQGYASNSSYPFNADVTWDADRNAVAKVVKQSDGTPVTGVNGTPVVRNRKSVVIADVNGLYQNGYDTKDVAFQYEFSTKGFATARFYGDIVAKNAARTNYKAQCSLDGTSFTDIEGAAWELTASTAKSVEFALPAEAAGKEKVYVRICGYGDAQFNTSYKFDAGTSAEGLQYCLRSESGVGNVYVMGEAEVTLDHEAPQVKNTLPATGATGVASSGNITVSYNEAIKQGNVVGARATLNGEELAAVWNSRSVSFQYANLKYGQTYTFSMPEGYVEDKSGNAAGAVEITFTVMDRQKPAARIFNAVVDATLDLDYGQSIAATETMPKQYRYIQDAINDAPETNAKPYLIYIKEGYYNDPNPYFSDSYGMRYTDATMAKTEKISGGKNEYDDCRLIFCNKPNVHLVGQAADKVTIATDRLDGSVANDWTKVWYHVNAGAAVEVQRGADDFMLSSLTVANENWTKKKMEGPQALCINTYGDRAIYNDVNVVSYQDDYKCAGTYSRAFWYNSRVEGAVDFIYGDCDVWFEGCTIDINRKAGGYIVAPSHPIETRWGYVFNNTKIVSSLYGDNCQVWLGRPWHGYPKTVFINSQMNIKPYDQYWAETMGGLPAINAVYNLTNKNGVKMSENSRIHYYADAADNTFAEGMYDTKIALGDGKFRYTNTAKNSLTDAEAAQYTIQNVLAGDRTTEATGYWNPLVQVEKTAMPTVSVNGNIASWAADEYAICYVVTVDGKAKAFVTEPRYVGAEGEKVSVQSVNEQGILSLPSAEVTLDIATAVVGIEAADSGKTTAKGTYTLDGKRVGKLSGNGVFVRDGVKVANR